MRRLLLAGLCCFLLCGAGAAAQDSGPIEDPAPPLPDAYLIFFAPESAELDGNARLVLDQLIKDYQVTKPAVLYVDGYYDRSATQEHADYLSKRMAEAVRNYLVAHGILAGAIKLAWHGENGALVETDDGVAEAANRSVDVRFTAKPNPRRF
jgi:OmpA-OmpF porin, OOP family